MYANQIDIENAIYNKYKAYMSNSRFNPKVFNKSPKQLKDFPTIIFKETSNRENTRYKTLDFSQTVNQITFTVEVYTQDLVIENVKFASKIVMNELKRMSFDFFQYCGFERTSCEYVDYYNTDIDRLIMTVRTNQASWNLQVV